MEARILDTIHKRRSVRRFEPGSIPDEALVTVLEAARWAPSAGNAQPWRFIVVENEATKLALVRAALGQKFLAEAPVVVVVVADLARAERAYGQRGRSLYCIQDTAAATQNMLLAAHELGLGACWVGAFHEDDVAQVLDLGPDERPVALVPLGWPGERPQPRARRPLDEVVTFLDR